MNIENTSVDRSNERCVALILALFLVTVMSVLAASLMFLSQTETFATMNYRMMSQARYGAESGVHAAANYFLNGYTAVEPGTAGDPMANYDTTVSPVNSTVNGLPVVLSASANVASNYPVAATITAFNNAAQGALTAGSTTVNYAAYATLLSMQQLFSDGTIGGARTATVEVSSTLDSQVVPGIGYGTFATGDGCGSIQFTGNSSTQSYDSSSYNGVGGITAANGGLSASGGNVGTNGNMSDSGNATVNGNLYSPRTGVGTCHNGGTGIAGDALTEGGHATLNGSVVQLPAPVAIPTPPLPAVLPPTTNVTGASCAAMGLGPPACTSIAGNVTINLALGAVSIGNLTLTGGQNVTIIGNPAAPSLSNFNINSISMTGNSTLTIQAGTYVKMDVAGMGPGNSTLATPIDFTGGSVSSNSYDASHFQIQYAGTGTIKMTGNAGTSEVIYAPNAAVSLTGNTNFYGAIISNTLIDSGNNQILYDRNLTKSMYSTSGTPWLTSFSWKKY
jgi:hypothetical protein